MRSIIAPHSICLGVINRLHNFAWTSCLPTARNSTLSNGSGSSRAGCVCTIVTSDSSMESFPPGKISLPNGQSPTISCADYAQLLRTLCLAALDAAAQAADVRAIVCVDAINERHGPDIWPERLAVFLKAAEAFPRVGIVLSCRST